jgi:protein gp37
MSDLFHARVPLSFVGQVFAVIADTPQHTYQILTKRSARLPRIAAKLDWPPNLWMGVSVEDRGALFRADHLRAGTCVTSRSARGRHSSSSRGRADTEGRRPRARWTDVG